MSILYFAPILLMLVVALVIMAHDHRKFTKDK